MEQNYWRQCSSCKKQISFKAKYFECSVSTCTGKRTGYVFCSVGCWERHLPGAKHRDAGAVEKVAPTFEQWQKENSETGAETTHQQSQPVRKIISNPQNSFGSPARGDSFSGIGVKTSMDQEILVVVSKMKTYIKEKADLNTSGEVADILSDMIRKACDQAILNARQDNRKTVMGRDFEIK